MSIGGSQPSEARKLHGHNALSALELIGWLIMILVAVSVASALLFRRAAWAKQAK
jgi:hypothetical protein